MTPQKKGYKVVAQLGDKFMSIFRPEHPRSVAYAPGVPARPKEGHGPLAVFGQKREALRFTGAWGRRWSRPRVFRCTYTPSRHKRLWDRLGESQHPLPPSTRFADEVTLLEEVKV